MGSQIKPRGPAVLAGVEPGHCLHRTDSAPASRAPERGRGRRDADSLGQAPSVASRAWRVPAVLTAGGGAGGWSGWWGLAAHTQSPSTAPSGIALRAALRELPRRSHWGWWAILSVPRGAWRQQGDGQQGSLGSPGWTWPQRQSSGSRLVLRQPTGCTSR